MQTTQGSEQVGQQIVWPDPLASSEDGSHLIFVYGTLLRGHHNNYLLRDSQFIREGQTGDGWRLFSIGVPVMVKSDQGRVVGEVFRVSPAVLANLDRLECHPRWYKRTALLLADRTPVEAYTMETAPQGSKYIPSGSWRNR